MGERCEVCDRPRATDEQWRYILPGERDDLCWGREQCEAGAVDSRARTELARLDLAAAIARAERAERVLASLPDCASRAETAELALGGLLARAERAEGLCAEAMYALGQQGRPADLMPMAVRAVVSRADAAEVRAERAEAGLAALREASRSVVHVAVVPYSNKGNALLQAFDKVIADTAAAAEAYRASVEAPLRAEIERITAERDEGYRWGESHTCAAVVRAESAERERDTLAAALAEVREIHAALVANDALPREAWSEAADAKHADLSERLDAAMAALPADLAAERFRRERAEALESAADAIERGSVLSQYGAHGWLRARAADERGGR